MTDRESGKFIQVISTYDEAHSDWLKTFLSIDPPPRLDIYDLASVLYNALHEKDIDVVRLHILEIAKLVGYREIDRGDKKEE